ncbi:aldehyde dehydrogenase family protein [Paraburkholderia tropica]|uniref:aldehyde dehydrogenase family protein n=1 Tax=Paraburkholderia tropica TaxID=92647 RepID=UPI002AAFB76E|nr:aldehyde dehydrogenase family protein [Paraburkholderia tropica]
METDYSMLVPQARAFIEREHGLRIAGETISVGSRGTIDVLDPSTNRVVARVLDAGEEQVDAAVSSARDALSGPWRAMRPYQRADALLRLAQLLERDALALSQIETINSGRLIANTRLFDVEFSVQVLRYMAGWATKIEGRTADINAPYIPDGEFFSFTTREPVGVVAGIVPWNVPLCQAVWKLAPALAAGCTLVLKPAQQTPLTALWLADLAIEAGIPPGVVNVVTGSGPGAGAALARHPGVDKISFTGSTAVGREIARHAAGSFRKVNLELGGKSPVIVFGDAKLDEAIHGAAWAIFGNHGQNCCAGSRLYVHDAIYEQVIDGVCEIAKQIRLGPGLDPKTQMGPLVSPAQQARVLSYIKDGRDAGATVRAGGMAADAAGCYVHPTVLTDVDESMKVVREEIFGPVLVAMPFGSEEDVLARANALEYGLGASVWTRDISRVHRFSRGLDAGNVWVNVHNVLDPTLPFGGYKDSGVGHDLGEESVLAHTRIKSTVIRL